MQNEIVEKLTVEFNRARAKNPAYSLRAFAKKLGIQPSALSEILNGKRVVSKKMGTKILLGLGLNDTIDSIFQQNSKDYTKQELSLDYFKAISEWYYFAILSLAEISSFQACPQWIANRLNITTTEASKALEVLKELGMLVEEKPGEYVVRQVHYTTPTDIQSSVLKYHTIQTLDLARESVLNDPVDIRDFSTITMAIDTSKIEEAKKMIKSFRRKISNKLESGPASEVYKLSIQLFPLSKGGSKENNNV